MLGVQLFSIFFSWKLDFCAKLISLPSISGPFYLNPGPNKRIFAAVFVDLTNACIQLSANPPDPLRPEGGRAHERADAPGARVPAELLPRQHAEPGEERLLGQFGTLIRRLLGGKKEAFRGRKKHSLSALFGLI